jgi:hypothetical protein
MIRFGAKVLVRAGALGAAVALVGSGVACSSSSAGNTASSGALSSDGGADVSVGVAENFDAAFDGQSSLTLKWVVTEQPAIGYGYGDAGGINAGAGDGGMSAVSGAQVCVYQNPSIPCVTTGDDGTFLLSGLPPMTHEVLTLNKAGYAPIAKPILTSSAPMDGTANPVRMTLASDPDPQLGFTIDWTSKGALSFFALQDDADSGSGFAADLGATVALAPMSGNGPFYLDGEGVFDPTGTALESGGVGYYYNLAPGNYTLTFTDNVNNCAPIDVLFSGYGFPDPPTSVQFPIIAGYTTELVGVICTPKPHLVDAGANH